MKWQGGQIDLRTKNGLKGGGSFIYAKSVRGQKPVHFVKKTLTTDKKRIVDFFKRSLLSALDV